jgi:hypothetical protein
MISHVDLCDVNFFVDYFFSVHGRKNFLLKCLKANMYKEKFVCTCTLIAVQTIPGKDQFFPWQLHW